MILKKIRIKEKSALLIALTDKWKITFYLRDLTSSPYIIHGNELELCYTVKGEFRYLNETYYLRGVKELSFDQLKVMNYFLDFVNCMLPEHQFIPWVYEILCDVIIMVKVCNNLALLTLYFELNMLTKLGYLHPVNAYEDWLGIDLDRVNYFNTRNLCINKAQWIHLNPDSIRILYFIQVSSLDEVLAIKLTFEDLKRILLIFRDYLSRNSFQTICTFPCFLNENMVQ